MWSKFAQFFILFSFWSFTDIPLVVLSKDMEFIAFNHGTVAPEHESAFHKDSTVLDILDILDIAGKEPTNWHCIAEWGIVE